MSSVTAAWSGLGVNAGFAVIVAFLFGPRALNSRDPASFESYLSWFFYLSASLAGVLRFLAEAFKFGRWPLPPAAYKTTWLRFVGQGVASAAFLGQLSALNGGGVAQTLFVVVGALAYYAAQVFAALGFQTQNFVVGMYVVSCAVYLWTVYQYFARDRAQTPIEQWKPVASFLVEAGILGMAGVEAFNGGTASNQLESWVFFGLNAFQIVWYAFVYYTEVEATWLSAWLSPPSYVYVDDESASVVKSSRSRHVSAAAAAASTVPAELANL